MDILKKLNKEIKLTDNEKNIIEYITQHIDQIPYMSSRKLATETYTTATSITRLIRKLGYENYNDFKYNLVISLKNIDEKDFSIMSNEHILSVINKISTLEIETINQTKELIKLDILQIVASKIIEKTYIDIIANDTNAHIAQYAASILGCLGKIVQVYHETDRQLQYCINTNDQHLAIFISKHAINKHMLDCAMMLNKRNITTIAFTTDSKNALALRCNYVLVAPLNCDSHMNEIDFYMGIKYLFDLLYGILLSCNYEKIQKMGELHNQIFSHLL